jgi:hypothetical protein
LKPEGDRKPGLGEATATGRERAPWARAPWLLGGLALAVVAFFDTTINLPLNDEWLYAWSARQLVAGHGYLKAPDQSPLALTHVLWGVVLTLGHPDYRLLRLTLLPFALLTAWCVHCLSRRLGADAFWSGVAAAATLTWPIFLALSSTFMSDAPYTALTMVVAVSGVAWIRDGRGAPAFVVLTGLAFLERQQAVGLLLAVLLCLWVGRRERRRPAYDRVYAALAVLVIAGLAVGVSLTGLNASANSRLLSTLTTLQPQRIAGGVIFLPIMLGFAALPFMGALWRGEAGALPGEPAGLTARRWRNRVAFALCVMGMLSAAGLAVFGYNPFPGDYFSSQGLGPTHVDGVKPNLYPLPIYLLLAAVATVSGVVIVWRWRDGWMPRRLGREGGFVVAVAMFQLLPFLQTSVLDRYYLPVVLPLLPVIARFATAGGQAARRWARPWAVVAMALGLLVFAAGQQDYQAWEGARDAAARLAFATAPPPRVQAGFEANGVYVELPRYEREGLPASQVVDGKDLPSMLGPKNPVLRLVFAGPGAAGPGASWDSLAPGRIIVIPGSASYGRAQTP